MDLNRLIERLDVNSRCQLATLEPDGRVRRMSFGQIRREIERAMHALRARGVTAGMRLGLLAENCVEWMIYDVALLTMGCTTVAFPRDLAETGLREVFDRFDLSLMLLSAEETLPVDELDGRVHFIDADTPWTEPALPPRQPGAPEDFTPTLIFSSGSTGKTKCLVCDLDGVAYDIEYFYQLFDIHAGDRLLIFLPFDHFQQRVCGYACIWYGVDIALVQPHQVFNAFQRLAPTLCLAPPVLYETIHAQFLAGVDELSPDAPLVNRRVHDGVRQALGGAMRLMWTGMAPMKPDVLDFFWRAGIPLYEAYGTEECGIIATNAPGAHRPGSVGKALGDSTITLAGDGEVLVYREHFSTRSYWNREDDAQARTFLPSGHIATGDIGRFDSDGFLYLVGRKKEIIIASNGEKIHPELIEARLNEHALVERSAVFGNDLPHLVAVIVPRVAGRVDDEDAIRAHVDSINASRSTGMQIGRVVFASEPFAYENGLLTRTLKLDRRGIFQRFEAEIRGLRAGKTARSSEPAAPLTDTERELVAIWRDVLGCGDIGTQVRFLELGGNSLQAVQVVARIHEVFRVELPLRRLFEAGTIAAVARQIDAARAGGAATRANVPVIRRDETAREHPLSYAQQRMWMVQQLAPESRAYHLSGALELDGVLDTEVLHRAFLDVVARHDVLRTRFPVQEDGFPVAVVGDRADVAWELIDIAEHDQAEQEARVREIVRRCADQLFDLERGPLLRVTLVRRWSDRHVLILAMHHINFDGWSLDLLTRDLSAAYRNRAAADSADLPPLPVQYQDFARYQRAQIESGALDAQRAFWREALAGAPEHLELPFDFLRPSSSRSAGDTVQGYVPPALRHRVEALAHEHEATLPIALLAVFETLLHRYSGQEDLVVGVPVANRMLPQVESLIGCFINTLAHRADLSQQPSFREVLRRTRDSALDAFSHQELPLDVLVDELRPARAHSHMPLFQTLFLFQNAPATELILDGLSISIATISTGTAKFDLSLEVFEAADGGLDLSFEYSTEVFERQTVAGMMTSLERLVTACVDWPDRKVSRLPLTDEPLRQQMLIEWNRTQAIHAPELGLHQVIEKQAATTPDAVALRCDGRSMTYRDMEHKANALARALIDRGVAPGQIVSVYLERSMDMVVAILAVLKASAAYLPIDPVNPPGRIAYMLDDARVALVLTQRGLVDRLSAGRLPAGVTGLCLDTMDLPRVEDAPPWRGTPDSMLNLLYTSGSTGVPKGVQVHHRGICNYLYWRQSEMPMSDTDRMLQKTSVGFDVSCLELFQPLMNGATLVLARPRGEMDVDYLIDLIASEGVTFIHFVPSMLQVFLEGNVERCQTLRHIFSSGEALSRQVMLRCLERLPWAVLHNEYGPTEASINCSFWPCTSAFPGPLPPIGRPVSNCSLYVLDDDLQPVPPRLPGELFIGGVGLAHGYLHREDLTSERFIPDPFGHAGRLYRSGDIARYRNDGLLEYLGRRDQQVKLRGFRLELGEIESALVRLAGVREAAVAVQGEDDDKRLVAFVVADPDTAVAEADLVEQLRHDLPPHMIPSAIQMCDGLPRTSSGKLDRKALPQLDTASRATRTAYAAPRSRLEQQIAEIWSAVLKVDPVGIHDNFFDLGGHSFAATHIIARLRSALGTHIPLNLAFEEPTIARLAAALESRISADTMAAPDADLDRTGPAPISFAQEQLWLDHRHYPDIPIHNIPMVIRFHGGCDIDALERTMEQLAGRHEVLRTLFPVQGDKPVQVIAPLQRLSIPVTDMSEMAAEDRDSSLEQALSRLATEPFDLQHQRPFRLGLFKVSGSEHLLAIVMHHVITDGWSNGILVTEFAQLYEAAAQGRQHDLPALSHTYADFARQQRQQVELGLFDDQIAYWKKRLRNRKSHIALPRKSGSRALAGARYPVRISSDITERARSFSKEARVTLFVTLLAAFKSLLRHYSGQDDLCVGSPMTGRHQIEFHGVVGLFLNTIVLRTELSGEPCFREVVERVHEAAMGAYANQEVPFEAVAHRVWEEDRGERSPLFEIMFILQNPQETAQPEQSRLEVSRRYAGIAVYEITFSLAEVDGGLSGWIDYRIDSFDEMFAARMARDFEAALAILTRTPDERLSSLSRHLDARAGAPGRSQQSQPLSVQVEP